LSELYKYTKTFSNLGYLSKAHIEKMKDNWLVYARSSKKRKIINTHMFPNKKDALLTRDEINR